jgi:methionine-rich copper-binding protein CopC
MLPYPPFLRSASAALLTCVLIISSVLSTSAQLQEKYFYDQEPKDRGLVTASAAYGSGMIFGGKTLQQSGAQTTITRIDAAGNILWLREFPGIGDIRKFVKGSDDFIYVLSSDASSNFSVVTKLDGDGTSVWKKQINTVRPAYDLQEHALGKLLISFPSAYNGSDYTQQVGFVDKATGDLTTYGIGKVSWHYENIGIGSDAQGNVYYTLKDTVYSITGTAPYTTRWKKLYAGAGVLEFHHVHVDASNRLFFIGASTGTFQKGKILRVDPADGTLLSNAGISGTNEDRYQALAENATHLFITWSPIYQGQYSGWSTTKIDKSTGAIVWNTSYNLNGTQATTTLRTDGEGAHDILLDPDGNVFLTGCFDGGGSQGKWGILKLDGSTGARIFETLLPGNINIDQHRKSGGVSLYFSSNTVRALGNITTYRDGSLDNGFDRSTPALATVDPATGTISTFTYFNGNYEFPSQILSMERNGNDMIILKKLGRSLVLGRYDLQQNVKWEKILTDQYASTGKMRVTPSGKIALTVLRYRPSDYDVSYVDQSAPSWVDTYLFDADGTQSWKNQYPYGYALDLVDLHCDDNAVFAFFAKNNALNFRKITPSSVSNEVPVDISLHTKGSLPYVFDDTGSAIRLAGTKSGVGARVISFDKTSLTATVREIVFPVREISDAFKMGPDDIVITGRNSKSQDFIMRYNLASSQTAWKTVLGNTSSLTYKLFLHSSKKYIITLGASDIYTSLRKVDCTTGAVLNSYVNTSTGIKNIPVDAAINESKDEIVFTGYYQPSAGTVDQNIIIGSVTLPDLTLKQILYVTGDWPGNNTGTNVVVASDGNVWIGGNKNITGLHEAAFLYTGSLKQPANDVQGPVLTSTIPIASTVKPTAPLVLRFNEKIKLGTGTFTVFNTSNDTQLAQIPITSANTTIVGSIATVTPASPLPANVGIYIKIDAGTFQDLAGNAYAGNQDNRWAFTTDGKAPTLSAKAPSTSTLDVRLVTPLQLTFSENISVGSGTIKLYTSSGTNLIATIPVNSSTTTISGTIATVTVQSPYPQNATVYVKIDAGAFQDLAGNPYAGISNTSWSFYTSAADMQGPTISNYIPNIGSTVKPADAIQLSFREQIVVNSGSLRVYDASNDALVSTITLTPNNTDLFSGRAPYITPEKPLPPGKNLYIQIDEGLFIDLEGNRFAGLSDKSWTFTTSAPASYLVSEIPAPNATDVSPFVTLVLNFTETMVANSGRESIVIHDYATGETLLSFKLTDENTIFSGNRNYVTLPAPIPGERHVYVEIANGAFRTLASNSNGGNFEGIQDKQWHFTTSALPNTEAPADTQAPALISQAPANGATDVDLNTPLTLDFSEAILLGSGTVRIYNASNDALVTTVALSPSNTSITDSHATVTLPAALPASTTLYVKIDNGSFKDAAGNLFTGIADKRWSFTILTVADQDGPQLVSTIPANNAVETRPVHFLNLIFNEPVALHNGLLTVFDEATHDQIFQIALEKPTASVDGATVIVMLPEALPANRKVYIQVASEAITDILGNEFAGITEQQWAFSTPVVITGIETPSILHDIKLVTEGNEVRIVPQNTVITIQTITDVLGRMIRYERSGNEIVFTRPSDVFIIKGHKGNDPFVLKMIIHKL